MRSSILAFALLLSSPALATDHTDVIGEDTGDGGSFDTDGVADTDGQTASEAAGDPGGLACNTGAAVAGLATPAMLVGLLLVARRREEH